MKYANKVIRSKRISNGFLVEVSGDVTDDKGVVHYVSNEIYCETVENVCGIITQFLEGDAQ